LGLALMAATVAGAWAQTRAPAPTANPLQLLPKVEAPAQPSGVTLNVQRQQNPRLAALLSSTITPTRVSIAGVHAIPFAEVSALFKPLTGKAVRIGDLVAAANACTELYRKHGYALSFCYIPGQDFAGGTVKVTVIEGYVAEVAISGDAGTLEKKIRAIARHITADRPLRKNVFDRYIQVLGMLPGARIDVNVPAPTTTDGATRLELKVQRKRYNVSSGIDFNHPGVQGLISGVLNGLTTLGEQLSASAIYPHGRGDQEFYTAAYAQMIGSDGLTAKLSASHFHGNPDIYGDDGLPSYVSRLLTQDRVEAVLTYPLLLSPVRTLVASLGLYGADQDDGYFNRITGANLRQVSRVRVLHAELGYTRASERRVRKFSIGIAHGMDVWGADASLRSNVPGGSARLPSGTRFTRYNFSAVQSDTWGDSHWVTVASLSGQYSPNHLPSLEQTSFGGPNFGWAYDPGIVAGDSGWGASLEVNRPFSLGSAWLKTLTPYAVGQFARVYLRGTPLPSDTLRTFALGMRLTDGKHYTVDLNAAQPVGSLPPYVGHRQVRYNLLFSYQFQ
jgi:hemolysin activation/secretion protein